MLQFDWDDENIEHIAEHKVTPAEVEFVLTHRTLDVEYQDWHDEERFQEIGMTARGRFLVVLTTWRETRIRVVTAYDAPGYLIEEYVRTR